MDKKLPVIAAIPNYNMAEYLDNLLPSLKTQGYDAIYVLDDASTDDSVKVAKTHGAQVVQGAENKGAGANRNRIMQALHERAIIHFIDADTRLDSAHTPDIIRGILPDDSISFVGGMISTTKNHQHIWNYGPRKTLLNDIRAGMWFYLHEMRKRHPKVAMDVHRAMSWLFKPWPNQVQKPVAREIFWCAEANFVIDSATFQKIGLFDESLREHEIQDFAIRAHNMGLTARFDPAIAVTHLEGKVRRYNRKRTESNASRIIIRKHGVISWLFRL